MEMGVVLWKAMMTAFAVGGWALAYRKRWWLMEKNKQLYGLTWSESFTRKYVRVSFLLGSVFLASWTFALWFLI